MFELANVTSGVDVEQWASSETSHVISQPVISFPEYFLYSTISHFWIVSNCQQPATVASMFPRLVCLSLTWRIYRLSIRDIWYLSSICFYRHILSEATCEPSKENELAVCDVGNGENGNEIDPVHPNWIWVFRQLTSERYGSQVAELLYHFISHDVSSLAFRESFLMKFFTFPLFRIPFVFVWATWDLRYYLKLCNDGSSSAHPYPLAIASDSYGERTRHT